MLGMVGSVAAGSVLGNYVSDKFMGSGESGAAPAVQATGFEQSPCAQFRWNFDSCLAQNHTNISACQFNFDQFRNCMANPNSEWKA